MAPYPTTAAGLLVQLDDQADELAEYAAQLRRLADQFRLVPGTATRPDPVRRDQAGRPINRQAVRWASARARQAHGLAGALADVADQLPTLRAALRLALSAPVPDDRPLYIPDAADRTVFRDAGTGVAVAGDAAPRVLWWPRLSRIALDAGATAVTDVPPATLELSDCRVWFPPRLTVTGLVGDLYGWAEATAAVRAREADLRARYDAHHHGGSVGRRRSRAAVNAQRHAYTAWSAFLAPLGDTLTTRLGAYVSATTAALSAVLTDEGIDMPTLTGTPAVITNLATRIRDAITAGHGGRLVVSESEQAFSWAPGLPTSLLTYLAPQIVDGRRTTVVTASDAATTVGKVAEGAAKSSVVNFDSDEVALSKYPGQATITVESAMFVRNIEPAVANVIGSQIIRAVEADAVTAMQAGAGVAVTGAADITAGVLSAIAQLRAGGAAPNAVALSVNDWVAVMTATGQAGYLNFSNPEAGPVGTWLGLAPCIVPDLADGSAVVVDGRSAPVGEPAGGPLCIVDPFTQANTNKIVITIEAWAVPMVTSPGGVATVAVAAP